MFFSISFQNSQEEDLTNITIDLPLKQKQFGNLFDFCNLFGCVPVTEAFIYK